MAVDQSGSDEPKKASKRKVRHVKGEIVRILAELGWTYEPERIHGKDVYDGHYWNGIGSRVLCGRVSKPSASRSASGSLTGTNGSGCGEVSYNEPGEKLRDAQSISEWTYKKNPRFDEAGNILPDAPFYSVGNLIKCNNWICMECGPARQYKLAQEIEWQLTEMLFAGYSFSMFSLALPHVWEIVPGLTIRQRLRLGVEINAAVYRRLLNYSAAKKYREKMHFQFCRRVFDITFDNLFYPYTAAPGERPTGFHPHDHGFLQHNGYIDEEMIEEIERHIRKDIVSSLRFVLKNNDFKGVLRLPVAKIDAYIDRKKGDMMKRCFTLRLYGYKPDPSNDLNEEAEAKAEFEKKVEAVKELWINREYSMPDVCKPYIPVINAKWTNESGNWNGCEEHFFKQLASIQSVPKYMGAPSPAVVASSLAREIGMGCEKSGKRDRRVGYFEFAAQVAMLEKGSEDYAEAKRVLYGADPQEYLFAANMAIVRKQWTRGADGWDDTLEGKRPFSITNFNVSVPLEERLEKFQSGEYHKVELELTENERKYRKNRGEFPEAGVPQKLRGNRRIVHLLELGSDDFNLIASYGRRRFCADMDERRLELEKELGRALTDDEHRGVYEYVRDAVIEKFGGMGSRPFLTENFNRDQIKTIRLGLETAKSDKEFVETLERLICEVGGVGNVGMSGLIAAQDSVKSLSAQLYDKLIPAYLHFGFGRFDDDLQLRLEMSFPRSAWYLSVLKKMLDTRIVLNRLCKACVEESDAPRVACSCVIPGAVLRKLVLGARVAGTKPVLSFASGGKLWDSWLGFEMDRFEKADKTRCLDYAILCRWLYGELAPEPEISVADSARHNEAASRALRIQRGVGAFCAEVMAALSKAGKGKKAELTAEERDRVFEDFCDKPLPGELKKYDIKYPERYDGSHCWDPCPAKASLHCSRIALDKLRLIWQADKEVYAELVSEFKGQKLREARLAGQELKVGDIYDPFDEMMGGSKDFFRKFDESGIEAFVNGHWEEWGKEFVLDKARMEYAYDPLENEEIERDNEFYIRELRRIFGKYVAHIGTLEECGVFERLFELKPDYSKDLCARYLAVSDEGYIAAKREEMEQSAIDRFVELRNGGLFPELCRIDPETLFIPDVSADEFVGSEDFGGLMRPRRDLTEAILKIGKRYGFAREIEGKRQHVSHGELVTEYGDAVDWSRKFVEAVEELGAIIPCRYFPLRDELRICGDRIISGGGSFGEIDRRMDLERKSRLLEVVDIECDMERIEDAVEERAKERGRVGDRCFAAWLRVATIIYLAELVIANINDGGLFKNSFTLEGLPYGFDCMEYFAGKDGNVSAKLLKAVCGKVGIVPQPKKVSVVFDDSLCAGFRRPGVVVQRGALRKSPVVGRAA